MQHQGLRIIPLALCEVAWVFDPGTPRYLTRAAMLCDDMGMSDRADSKRDLLRRRATVFASAVNAELVYETTRQGAMPWEGRPANSIDHVPLHNPPWIEPFDIEQPRPRQ
jgi:hypothetical protein